MKASVILIVKNEARHIGACLAALCAQTHADLEIVVIDNDSRDGTANMVRHWPDGRVQYVHEPAACGLASLRNRALDKVSGRFIFFTDGDCRPSRYWIEAGLRVLEAGEYVGVAGATFYESQSLPTIRDADTHQFAPGEFMTCNVAYSRQALTQVGGFDPAFANGHEDRDLALRVLRIGKIAYSPDMVVAHQKKVMGCRQIFALVRRAGNMVWLLKKHGREAQGIRWVLYPKKLLKILFPPLLFVSESFRSWRDLIFGFCFYAALVYERLLIWKAAWKNKIFVL